MSLALAAFIGACRYDTAHFAHILQKSRTIHDGLTRAQVLTILGKPDRQSTNCAELKATTPGCTQEFVYSEASAIAGHFVLIDFDQNGTVIENAEIASP
jgi:hypothetical protein